MRNFEYTVKDKLGIHARPAGQLVKIAKELDSEITVAKGESKVGAKKLIALMGLGIKCGDTIKISISGGNEEASERAMRDFLSANL